MPFDFGTILGHRELFQHDALGIKYDNTSSGLAALEVQAAIDEIVTGVGVIDHGNLAGLLDDDHTQYLLIDGSRSMTGTLQTATLLNDIGTTTLPFRRHFATVLGGFFWASTLIGFQGNQFFGFPAGWDGSVTTFGTLRSNRGFTNASLQMIIQKASILNTFKIQAQLSNNTGNVVYLTVSGTGNASWSGGTTGAFGVSGYLTTSFNGIAGNTMLINGHDSLTISNTELRVNNLSTFGEDADEVDRFIDNVNTDGIVNINSQQNNKTVAEFVATRICADVTVPAVMHLLKADGTFASPDPVADGAEIADFRASGWDGVQYSPVGNILFSVSGSVSSGRVPGKMQVLLRRPTGGDNREMLAMSFNEGIRFNSELENVDFIVDGQSADLIFGDASAGRVGIATNTPGATLDVSGSALVQSALSVHEALFNYTLSSVVQVPKVVSVDSSGNAADVELALVKFSTVDAVGAIFAINRAKGTSGAPAAVVDNSVLWNIQVNGYTSANEFVNGAELEFSVDGTVGATAVPTQLDLRLSDPAGVLQDIITASTTQNVIVHDRLDAYGNIDVVAYSFMMGA